MVIYNKKSLAAISAEERKNLSKIRKIFDIYVDNEGVFHSETIKVVYINSEFLVIIKHGDPKPEVVICDNIYWAYEDAAESLIRTISDDRPYSYGVSYIHKYAANPPLDGSMFAKIYKAIDEADTPINDLKKYLDNIKNKSRYSTTSIQLGHVDRYIKHYEEALANLNEKKQELTTELNELDKNIEWSEGEKPSNDN